MLAMLAIFLTIEYVRESGEALEWKVMSSHSEEATRSNPGASNFRIQHEEAVPCWLALPGPAIA